MTIEHYGTDILISNDDPFLQAIKSGRLDLNKESDFYKGLVQIKRLLED